MVRAEQVNALHPNRELPKGEVIFSRRLTLREVLQIKPGEEGETKDLLNDVPFDFEIRDIGKSLLHTASFSQGRPTGLSELFPLLQAAKPGGRSRSGQDTYGIDADWRIILPEVREKEPRSKELYDFHKEHVPGFSEFEKKHFPLFWNVFRSGLSRHEEVNFFNDLLERLVDKEKLLADYGKESILSNPQKRQAMLNAYNFPFVTFLQNEKGYKVPTSVSEWRKHWEFVMSEESPAIEFYEYLTTGVKEKELEVAFLARDYSTKGFAGRSRFVDRNGEVRVLDYSQGRLRFIPAEGFTLLPNGQTKISKRDSFMRISMREGEDGYKRPKIEESHLTTPEPETMIPLIVWEKDKATGKRAYHCGRLDGLPGHDTLLGQLVVAAYSPKVRDQMPREIEIRDEHGRVRKNQMLEAQTVLLVPRFANEFLTKSPVILGLEALAKNSAN